MLLPVPLKYHTETALILILALLIAAHSFAAAHLPSLPHGLLPWMVLAVSAVVYPLSLKRMFRINRADYELRLLHWFPLGILVLWLLLELLASLFTLALMLKMGFVYLWSLPLAFLGIFLLILYVVRVMRRSRVRLASLTLLLALFVIGGLVSEREGWQPDIQAFLFPETALSRWIAELYRWVPPGSSLSPGIVAETGGVQPMVSGATSSGAHLRVEPRRLARSGPEHIGLLAMLVLAAYTTTLHRRVRALLSS